MRVPVERNVRVSVEAQDETARRVRVDAEGLEARILQHEIDHLDGVLIIDRTTPEARREAMGALRPEPGPGAERPAVAVASGSQARAGGPRRRCERLAAVAELDVAVVLTQPDRPAGRGRSTAPPAVAGTARSSGSRSLQPERPAEALPLL